jgi:hypothetical protein
MNDLDLRLTTIKRKIREKHIELASPLDDEDVASFEEEHGITLPEDYRRFLVEIGNGGSKGPPLYGLKGLGEMPNDHHREAEEQLAGIKEPFPLTEAWIWENEDDLSEEQEAVIARIGDSGTLVLGTDGCGMYLHLVITGPERGQIWMVCGEGATPLDPRRDFLGWFEDWLLTAK